MCASIKKKREEGWGWGGSLMRHQSEEQPEETKFLHLPHGANKGGDELAADAVKALGVEIAIYSLITIWRKEAIHISLSSISSSHFPPSLFVSVFLHAFKGKSQQLYRRPSMLGGTAVWAPCLKSCNLAGPDSSITDWYKAQSPAS